MLKRTHRCGELRSSDEGEEVTVGGWVSNWRDHGGLIFLDIRDRYGVVQVVFNPEEDEDLHSRAGELRSEYCIGVRGLVQPRPEGMENPDVKTGQIEVRARELEVFSESETPPFNVQNAAGVSREVRQKYRFLDMRRPEVQRNFIFRHRLAQTVRRFFDSEDFLEVETPFLTKSTPEGARDYLVPSRVNPGKFYALPQSPQLFKQVLMVGGMDRYFQIVKCFRDEDLRADRQPEFTQVDMEMSFADEEDVLDCTEALLERRFDELLDEDISPPLPRMTFREAMEKYGTDAPDLRFGLEIRDISDISETCDFRVFSGAVEDGGQVRGICVPDGASLPRSDIDDLIDWVEQFGAKGLAWFKMEDGEAKSGVSKFFSEGEISSIAERFGAGDGDLLLFVADQKSVCDRTLANLRTHMAEKMDLIDEDAYELCWVVEAPQFERDEETGALVPLHHPFTAPFEEDLEKMESEPTGVRTRSYDIVLNGIELGGGSVRISDPELQLRVLRLLGIDEDEAEEKFGFLLQALRYGAPPHAGIALGLDRMTTCMLGLDDIRETIAFPKTQKAVSPFTGAPTSVHEDQLDELHISTEEPVEEE